MIIDKTDKRILQLLQMHGDISNLQLADKVGLSPTPCARRVKRLEEEGFIERRVTILNRQKLNLNLTAIISISLDSHAADRLNNFAELVQQYSEIIECQLVTGQTYDFLLKAVIPDMKYYEELLLGRLTRIKGVTGVHSSFVLREIVSKTELPLNYI